MSLRKRKPLVSAFAVILLGMGQTSAVVGYARKEDALHLILAIVYGVSMAGFLVAIDHAYERRMNTLYQLDADGVRMTPGKAIPWSEVTDVRVIQSANVPGLSELVLKIKGGYGTNRCLSIQTRSRRNRCSDWPEPR